MVLLASEFDNSRFLKAADVPTEKKFRIKNVTAEVFGTGDDKQRKPILWFTNDERGLVLNKTNRHTLQGAFGDTMDSWAGEVVVLFSTIVEMRGKMVPALRVRIPAPKQAATAGNGQAAAAPPQSQPAPSAPLQQLDEFGQSQSPAKPSLAEDMDDEIPF
jgi:hypothetical protein